MIKCLCVINKHNSYRRIIIWLYASGEGYRLRTSWCRNFCYPRTVADPEVLSRGRIEGTQRGLDQGRGPLPRKFWILKVKMAHFCALLSIDFKVCRLIIETVSDLIRKTVTNRLCFPPFFRASEARTRKYCDSGYKQHFFHTLHYRTAQGKAVDTLKCKDRLKSPWRQEKV